MRLTSLILAIGSVTICLANAPALFADPPIYTELDEGIFTLTAVGAFSGSQITLESLSVPPVETETVKWLAGSGDYFILRDNDSVAGARIMTQFSYSAWEYSGAPEIEGNTVTPVSQTQLVPKYLNEPVDPTLKITPSLTTQDLEDEYSFLVLAVSTAAPAESLSMYTFPNVSGGSMIGTTSQSIYLRSEASTPVKSHLRIDGLMHSFSGGTAPGDYDNVLNIILVAGSGI